MSKATLIINNFDHVLTIEPRDMSNMIDHVPAMVYKAMIKDKIILIKDRPTFTLPKKRYGRHNRYFQQISAAYDKSGPAIGILLQGDKGSGKSLLAEELGNWAIKQDVPVVMVTEPMSAEVLGLVIRAVGPCVVYFDEFGKIYNDEEDRNRLLPLFSDTSLKGVMFIITGNSSNEFSDYLYYRPQRFRFGINFHSGPDAETIQDILDSHEVPEQYHEMFHAYGQYPNINFDVLLHVVREIATVKDEEELRERVQIMNVPNLPVLSWGIEEINVLDEGDGEEMQYAFTVSSTTNQLSLLEGEGDGCHRTIMDIKREQIVDGKLDLIVVGKCRYRVCLEYGYRDLPGKRFGAIGVKEDGGNNLYRPNFLRDPNSHMPDNRPNFPRGPNSHMPDNRHTLQFNMPRY